jgi:uncharacterized protein DUF998
VRISTRALLTCGAVAGPLFLLVVLVQDYTRPGFDPRRHPLSLLAQGEGGGVQAANFVLAGLLDIAFAVGLRRAWRGGPGGTWAPPLIAGYGLGLVVAGVFRTDPAWGYPPGAPDARPEPESLASGLHGVGFLLLFVSLVAACFVLARAFAARGDRPWSVAAAAVGVALPVLLGLALLATDTDPQPLSLLLRVITLVGWGFAALVALRVRARLGAGDRREALAGR